MFHDHSHEHAYPDSGRLAAEVLLLPAITSAFFFAVLALTEDHHHAPPPKPLAGVQQEISIK
jgi:hypothetical protein